MIALAGALLGGATAAVASKRYGLAGIRDLPDRDRRILGPELEDAERRARAAGATGDDLDYIGAGAEGIVFCDANGRAFKVARHGDKLADEAAWFQRAAQIPSIKQHVPRDVHYNANHRVLVRECVQRSGKRPPKKLWELHNRMASIMKSYGHGRPEFKEDSYIMTRRGLVLVDAGFALKHGRELVKQALAVINGREHLEPFDVKQLSWDIRAERGETIPEPIANRLLTKLQKINPDVEV